MPRERFESRRPKGVLELAVPVAPEHVLHRLPDGVLSDPELASDFVRLHIALETPTTRLGRAHRVMDTIGLPR